MHEVKFFAVRATTYATSLIVHRIYTWASPFHRDVLSIYLRGFGRAGFHRTRLRNTHTSVGVLSMYLCVTQFQMLPLMNGQFY